MLVPTYAYIKIPGGRQILPHGFHLLQGFPVPSNCKKQGMTVLLRTKRRIVSESTKNMSLTLAAL